MTSGPTPPWGTWTETARRTSSAAPPDGRLYFYRGLGCKSRLLTEEAAPLTDSEGRQLSVSSYSAPVLCDVDGNGVLDILCGAGDGKVYLFLGQGGLEFKPMGAVIEAGLSGQVLPDYGDLDGDGIADVVCGSNEGKLLVFYGTGPLSFTAAGKELSVFGVDGSWIAPRIYDIDGTGARPAARHLRRLRRQAPERRPRAATPPPASSS